MSKSKLAVPKQDLLAQLITIANDLPPEQIEALADFAEYLRAKYPSEKPERKTTETIIEALERVGPLEFEPGELEAILAEIQQMRDRGFEEHG